MNQDDEKRLVAMAKSLAKRLPFAAPECIEEKIGEYLRAAFSAGCDAELKMVVASLRSEPELYTYAEWLERKARADAFERGAHRPRKGQEG